MSNTYLVKIFPVSLLQNSSYERVDRYPFHFPQAACYCKETQSQTDEVCPTWRQWWKAEPRIPRIYFLSLPLLGNAHKRARNIVNVTSLGPNWISHQRMLLYRDHSGYPALHEYSRSLYTSWICQFRTHLSFRLCLSWYS